MLKIPTTFQEWALAQAKLPPHQQSKPQVAIYMQLLLQIMCKGT